MSNSNRKNNNDDMSYSQSSPVKANDIGLNFQDGNFMMNSVNETNNEIQEHISKLDISGDEQIEGESN